MPKPIASPCLQRHDAGQGTVKKKDNSPLLGAWTELGRLGRPYGLKGWLYCDSFADPEEKLLGISHWRVRLANNSEREVELTAHRRQNERWVVKLRDVESPEAAQLLAGAGVWVPRSELSPTAPGEFYRADLLGLTVRNLEGRLLGKVDHFIDAPANAVMVVIGEREHWLPAGPSHLKKVDLAAGEVVVDWPADF